jgi:hypothetical protein
MLMRCWLLWIYVKQIWLCLSKQNTGVTLPTNRSNYLNYSSEYKRTTGTSRGHIRTRCKQVFYFVWLRYSSEYKRTTGTSRGHIRTCCELRHSTSFDCGTLRSINAQRAPQEDTLGPAANRHSTSFDCGTPRSINAQRAPQEDTLGPAANWGILLRLIAVELLTAFVDFGFEPFVGSRPDIRWKREWEVLCA